MDKEQFLNGFECLKIKEIKRIDGLISHLMTYATDYDLGDTIAVENEHLDSSWVENLATFEIEAFEDAIQTGFIGTLPFDLNPKTIALTIAALTLKKDRVINSTI